MWLLAMPKKSYPASTSSFTLLVGIKKENDNGPGALRVLPSSPIAPSRLPQATSALFIISAQSMKMSRPSLGGMSYLGLIEPVMMSPFMAILIVSTMRSRSAGFSAVAAVESTTLRALPSLTAPLLHDIRAKAASNPAIKLILFITCVLLCRRRQC